MTTPLPFNPSDKGTLQAALADIGYTLEQAFAKAERVWAKVETARNAGLLTQPPFSYTDAQVAWLDRVVSDMHSLAQVAYGNTPQPAPYNFMDAVGQETGFR